MNVVSFKLSSASNLVVSGFYTQIPFLVWCSRSACSRRRDWQ